MQDTEDQDMVEITHDVRTTITLSPYPAWPVLGQASPRKSPRPSPGSSGRASETPDSSAQPNNGDCAGKGKAPADDTLGAAK
jgi:hypothetical protein